MVALRRRAVGRRGLGKNAQQCHSCSRLCQTGGGKPKKSMATMRRGRLKLAHAPQRESRCYHGAASGEAADGTRAHGRRQRRNWTFEIPALRHAAPRLPGRFAARRICRRRRLSRLHRRCQLAERRELPSQRSSWRLHRLGGVGGADDSLPTPGRAGRGGETIAAGGELLVRALVMTAAIVVVGVLQLVLYAHSVFPAWFTRTGYPSTCRGSSRSGSSSPCSWECHRDRPADRRPDAHQRRARDLSSSGARAVDRDVPRYRQLDAARRSHGRA